MGICHSHLVFPPHNFPLIYGLFNSAMKETKEALENASGGLQVLQEGTGKLNFNLSLVRTSINRTLNDPGCHDEKSDATSAQLCRNIRQSLSQLQISANFTRVQNLNATHSDMQITYCGHKCKISSLTEAQIKVR